MMIGCVLNSLLLFQLFLLLMDFNPFLITRGIPITGLFFIVIKSQDHPPPPPPPRIIHTNLSHLSCLLYPIVRSTCAFVVTSFRIIFVSSKFLHHFFFFFFPSLNRVDVSSNKAHVESVRRITNFSHDSRVVSVKRVCEFRLHLAYLLIMQRLCCNRHTISTPLSER